MIKKYSYSKDKDIFLTDHFQVGEFRSFDDERGILTTDEILIDENLPVVLEKLFAKLNCSAIYITSGYRSEDFDIRLGGFAGYHSKGQAADIICYDQNRQVIDAKKVCIASEEVGILGIGYGRTYTHVDTRDWKSFFDETNGAVNIGSWYDYFGIKRPEPPKPQPAKYSVGDRVVLNGYLYTDSYGNGRGAMMTGHVGTITIVNPDGTKPYHIDNLGWVSGDELSATSGSIVHTVKKGEYLIKIGEQYGVDWREIAKVNGVEGPEYIIEIGQKLVIPK